MNKTTKITSYITIGLGALQFLMVIVLILRQSFFKHIFYNSEKEYLDLTVVPVSCIVQTLLWFLIYGFYSLTIYQKDCTNRKYIKYFIIFLVLYIVLSVSSGFLPNIEYAIIEKYQKTTGVIMCWERLNYIITFFIYPLRLISNTLFVFSLGSAVSDLHNISQK